MEEVGGDNHTSITEFLLLGFGTIPQLQIFLFLLFLVIYMLTVTGNILIIVLVVADPQLHTPMYFFLGNLSYLETCYTSTVLPRMLASLLTGDRIISVKGCVTQLYFFGCLATTECYLLAAMSYDRYLAICKPLLYAMLMNGRVCLLLATGSWLGGLLVSIIIISFMPQLTFCGHNEIDHFFCDFTPVIQLSCSDTRLVILISFITSFFSALSPFLLTLASYICIIDAILRIPSGRGRQKAFATCSSHLIVVTIFYGTILIVYLLPKNNMLRYLNKAFSVFYTILTPLINPLIYSLRNREVKEGLRKVVSKFRILRIQTTRLI
ncbi:olfactory receptor 6N1-like [Alligator mississippiensis]|uniref:olfactory receptor 6N1-like n=1 Tax=Alligator mississippiensis TaxID=8496 RepID=UPI0028777854|nr:olfactory receptor 6N1-like [Alligator mississippiensis]